MMRSRHAKTLRTIPFLIAACFIGLPASAKYSGGTGEPNDPYQIATAADLIALGETPEDYDKHFILTADIDLDPNLPGRKVFDAALIAPNWNTPFIGVFDGNGHTISHLRITGGSYLGLFGRLSSWNAPACEVKNLGMLDVSITGSDHTVGALVGVNSARIAAVYSTGSVSGTWSVGGLVGSNEGFIAGSHSAVAVKGSRGGVGGLAGSNEGSITNCHSAGSAIGGWHVGGLVGSNGSEDGYGTVTHCYSSTTVSAMEVEESVGGLVPPAPLLAWWGCGSVNSSFWDIEASRQSTSCAGTGKTTAEMRTAKTFLDAGWDFVGETTNGTGDIWKIAEGLGYPRLAWEKYSGGTGEPNDPYQIATAADLIALGEMPADYDKHFILTADIDLDPNLPGGKVFDRAAIAPDTDPTKEYFQGTPFTGVFDGNGHTIAHLTIAGDSYLGLFGILVSWDTSACEIRSLGLVDVNVAGSGGDVGGLVGYSNHGASIVSSYSSGSVSGIGTVGGLVGSNYGSLTMSHSAGSVSGSGSSVGGLVGFNGGSVFRCYSTAATSGTSGVGGLVGSHGWHRSSSSVSQSYCTGPVTGSGEAIGGLAGSALNGSITFSFWDVQTSGQPTSAGGTGKTTAEMQDIRIYQNAGWDFRGESGDGLHEVWQTPQGGGYPVLAILSGYVPPQLSGRGTAEDPYLISNAVELGAIYYHDLDAHYRLTASIDLSDIQWGSAVIPSFEGVFDGSSQTISHLTIIGGSDLGLFGRLGSWNAPVCEVRNLGLVDVNIVGSGSDVGGLAGNITEWCVTVTHCHSNGSVRGSFDVGGLIGSSGEYNENGGGDVTDCWSDGVVSGDFYVGGLVGANGGGVGRCWSTASVNATVLGAGGLIGRNEAYVPGMTGWGAVRECYSAGAVSGNGSVGGLVGDNPGWIAASYSTSSVSGIERVGGLVGANGGTIATSYSTGSVSGERSVGGLVGENILYGWSGGVASSFWDTKTSGQTDSDGGTGKTTAEMQTASTFLEAGWDFVGETANGTEDIWKIAEGLDYPRLWWEPYDGRVTVVLGQVFTVTLESNPSTGYRWEWVDHQDSIVEQMGEAQFKPRETGDPPLVGAGGWESSDFKAVHQGQMTLKLVYRRPWEEGVEPLKTFSLHVTVP
jgi:predicted secreted protein